MAYNAKEIEEKLTHKCTFWSYIFPSIERKFLTQNFDDSIRIANEIAEFIPIARQGLQIKILN